MANAAILDFQKCKILTVNCCMKPICAIEPNFIKSVKRLRRYRDSTVFLNGSRPPSWISIVLMWTTHDEYLVVSIVVQNLAGIDAVVLIICDFQYLARYRLEMPIFYSPKMGFMW